MTTISILEMLSRTLVISEESLRQSESHAEQFKSIFEELADQRRGFAEALETLVSTLSEEDKIPQPWRNEDLHVFCTAQAAVFSYGDLSLIRGCERLDAAVITDYETAICQPGLADRAPLVMKVVHSQYCLLRESCKWLREISQALEGIPSSTFELETSAHATMV